MNSHSKVKQYLKMSSVLLKIKAVVHHLMNLYSLNVSNFDNPLINVIFSVYHCTGPFEKPVSVFIKLTNTTCKKVCYKMKTTVPERFCVKPPFGTIDPKGAATITVTLQSFGSDRNDLEAKFQVLSAITPEGKYSFDTMVL